MTRNAAIALLLEGGAGSPALSVLSGMGAGAAMVAVGHPLGRIASCVQASPESYWSCARRAVSVCGFRTLYKAAPFMSSAVSSGICLGAFDIVRTGVHTAPQRGMMRAFSLIIDNLLTPLAYSVRPCVARFPRFFFVHVVFYSLSLPRRAVTLTLIRRKGPGAGLVNRRALDPGTACAPGRGSWQHTPAPQP